MRAAEGRGRRGRGIGQVGVGGIASTHREGYRAYGMTVVAGCDHHEAALAMFRAEEPYAAGYSSVRELLADPAVQVVDVAVPHRPGLREAVLAEIVAAGKPALVQKPLAMTYREAERIVLMSAAAGVAVMVNQNMCFTPAALTLQHQLGVARLIGTPHFAQIRTEAKFDTDRHHWYGRHERWWTVALSVHHLGLFQHLFGPPASVHALIGAEPGQPGVTGNDGYGHLSLRYPDGMHALLVLSGTYYGAHQVAHGSEAMWVQGSDGLLDWSPDGPVVLSVRRPGDRRNVDRMELPAMVEGVWFPHAFGLAMAHFQDALAGNVPPWCSVADNLYVMAAIEAAYRSAAEDRVVRLVEIMGDRYDPDYGPGWRHGPPAWAAVAAAGIPVDSPRSR